MKDVQSQKDDRRIDIHKVGVKDISYPITVLHRSDQIQKTVGRINMYVNLPHQFKGTHMSRFVEILNRFHGNINLKSFHLILKEMKTRLDAEAAHMEVEFPYFLKTEEAGITPPHAVGITSYRCRMHGSLGQKDDLILEVEVPVSSRPQSPGAARLPRSPGRWGTAFVCLRLRHFIWLEEVIEMVEEVTADNLAPPAGGGHETGQGRSVEELTRAVAERLTQHQAISWFRVAVENLAAGYSTYAAIEWPEEIPL